MNTLSDYLGRTTDMAAFRSDFSRSRSNLLAHSLITEDDGGAIVAGIQKLAQRVLLQLLRKKGSCKYDPDGGTDFMRDAERGQWRTAADVEQSFYAARTDLRRQIQKAEADTDPDDERYGGLEIGQIILDDDKVTCQLSLVSLAGTNYVFLTPITVPMK